MEVEESLKRDASTQVEPYDGQPPLKKQKTEEDVVPDNNATVAIGNTIPTPDTKVESVEPVQIEPVQSVQVQPIEPVQPVQVQPVEPVQIEPVQSVQVHPIEPVPVQVQPVERTAAPVRLTNVVINEGYTVNPDLTTLVTEHKAKLPAHYTLLPDFLDETFLEVLKENLNGEEWTQERNDVCTYEHTMELKHSGQKNYQGHCSSTRRATIS